MKKEKCDLIQRMIIMLAVVYALFFSMDVVLPGLVSEVFNTNLLLLGILVSLGVVVFNKGKCQVENVTINKKIIMLLALLLMAVNVVALYKVSGMLIIIYTGICFLIFRLLYKLV
jgi:hypothetical protein